MSLKRPSLPKIKPSIRKPRRTPRAFSPKVRTTGHRKSVPKTTKSKKKHTLKLGTCYSRKGCKGDVLLFRVTKTRCKAIGGKSWKSPKGCEPIAQKKRVKK